MRLFVLEQIIGFLIHSIGEAEERRSADCRLFVMRLVRGFTAEFRRHGNLLTHQRLSAFAAEAISLGVGGRAVGTKHNYPRSEMLREKKWIVAGETAAKEKS